MSAAGPVGRYKIDATEVLRDVRGRETARREWERDGAGGLEGARESDMMAAASACSYLVRNTARVQWARV